MKRFIVEVEDYAWEDICQYQKEVYTRNKISMPVPPPVDEDVFYGYLLDRMEADLEWPDPFTVGVTIIEATPEALRALVKVSP